MKRIFTLLLSFLLALPLASCAWNSRILLLLRSLSRQWTQIAEPTESTRLEIVPPEKFVLVNGGAFQMGSLESEAWHSENETIHAVTVSDFYISKFELTQAEYRAVMGGNPRLSLHHTSMVLWQL